MEYKVVMIFGCACLLFLGLGIYYPISFRDEYAFLISVSIYRSAQFNIESWGIQAVTLAISGLVIINTGVTFIKWGPVFIQFQIIQGIINSYLRGMTVAPHIKIRQDYMSLSLLISMYNDVFGNIYVCIMFVFSCIGSLALATAIFHKHDPTRFPFFFFQEF